jgi:hypothetical protein
MRLLYKRINNRFLFPLVRIWFLKAGNRIVIINIHSILGIIKEDRVMVCLQVISKQSLYRGQTLNSNL